MKELGIEVSIKGASWDDIYPHQYSDPILWGWGSNAPVETYELNYSTGWGLSLIHIFQGSASTSRLTLVA